MLPKYAVEYSVTLGQHNASHRYDTDGPVSCTEFVSGLLERGFRITGLLHEEMPLEQKQADQIIKHAAAMLAARHTCASLGIDAAEEHHRFGFST